MNYPSVEIKTLETLTVWRLNGDQITNHHLRRLASEDWYLIRGEREDVQGQSGYRYTFERWVVDASVATLLQSSLHQDEKD